MICGPKDDSKLGVQVKTPDAPPISPNIVGVLFVILRDRLPRFNRSSL
jgi:hypothetical protein